MQRRNCRGPKARHGRLNGQGERQVADRGFVEGESEHEPTRGAKRQALQVERERNHLLLTDRQPELPRFMRDGAAKEIQPMSVSLSELASTIPTRERLIDTLSRGFESALGVTLEAEPGR